MGYSGNLLTVILQMTRSMTRITVPIMKGLQLILQSFSGKAKANQQLLSA